MFEVVDAVASGVGTTYTIRNVATGEVRLLRDCVLLDLEVFDECDFDECEVI
jgi:hypothetical protein